MLIEAILTDKDECPNVKFLMVEGLKATQSEKVVDLLNQLKKEKFELAIELGTQQGGFSVLVNGMLHCEVHTFDIQEWEPIDHKRGVFQQRDIHYHIEDCFESKGLMELLSYDRKKILFCDGGHKVNEFTYFAKYLNKGDFIGCHDFFYAYEKYDPEIWTTCEITLGEIQHTIDELDLKQVYKEESQNAAWGLFKV